jgi:hypothetical protein
LNSSAVGGRFGEQLIPDGTGVNAHAAGQRRDAVLYGSSAMTGTVIEPGAIISAWS